PAQRGRARHPGDRAAAGLARRRHRDRRVPVLLPRRGGEPRRLRAQLRLPDGPGAGHGDRRGVRRGQPGRRRAVDPVHPASEDGDQLMSVMTTTRRIGRQRRLVTGMVITLVITVLAIVGPWLAPYGENEIVGKPFTMEGSWLGTDYLGQDVWSRVLAGGGSILVTAALATALGMVVGIVIGVVAAYSGGWLDEAIMRLNDVALAFPQILLALLVLTAVDQPAWWMIVLLVGASHAPRVARVARGVALGVVSRDFVHAAEALGESRLRVMVAEVLPNMNAPLLAEAGLRLTYSIGMVAGIGFLGFATNPGAADWGQMINENRLALLVQPWGVLAPVIVIGIFTVGTNLMADGIAQLAGRS